MFLKQFLKNSKTVKSGGDNSMVIYIKPLNYKTLMFLNFLIFSKNIFSSCICGFIVVFLLFLADMSVREECNEDPGQSDETEAETSPPKSPSTPKNVKSKNSGTVGLCGPSWCCQHLGRRCLRCGDGSSPTVPEIGFKHSPDGLEESF